MKIVAFLLCIFIVGCQGSSKQSFYSKDLIEWPDGTRVETISYGTGEVVSPRNAESPTELSIDSEGVISIISGSMKKLSGEIEKAGSWIYFTASIVLILGGIIVAYLRKEYVFGGILIGSGLLMAGIPTILDELGLIVLITIILMIGAGVTYILGKYVFKWNLLRRNAPAIIKLNEEGKPEEATAIARAIDPALDKAYKEKEKLKKKHK